MRAVSSQWLVHSCSVTWRFKLEFSIHLENSLSHLIWFIQLWIYKVTIFFENTTRPRHLYFLFLVSRHLHLIYFVQSLILNKINKSHHIKLSIIFCFRSFVGIFSSVLRVTEPAYCFLFQQSLYSSSTGRSSLWIPPELPLLLKTGSPCETESLWCWRHQCLQCYLMGRLYSLQWRQWSHTASHCNSRIYIIFKSLSFFKGNQATPSSSVIPMKVLEKASLASIIADNLTLNLYNLRNFLNAS